MHICGTVGCFFKLLCHWLIKLCIHILEQQLKLKRYTIQHSVLQSLKLNFLQNELESGTSSNTCTQLLTHQLYGFHYGMWRKVVSVAQQASRPSSHHKHLSSELCLSPPPVTSRGLDKWQVVLKRVPIHSHDGLPIAPFLQFGGGVEGRGGNVEAGQPTDCENISKTGKQARHKEVHSCLCAAIKEVL